MRIFILMIALCQVADGQSIIVSGDGRSIVVSGRSEAAPVKTEPIVVKPVVVPAPQHPVKQVQKVKRRYVAMFTASYCGPCQIDKRDQLPKVRSRGHYVREVEMTLPENIAAYESKVSGYPTYWICDWETGVRIGDPIVGPTSGETLIALLGDSPPVQTVIPVQPQVRYEQPQQASGRFVTYGGRTYDMETWRRMCSMRNCGMCQYLDSMKAQYLRNKAMLNRSSSVPSPQSSSPSDVVDEAISIAKLTDSDVVGELGSGSGETAIRMVQASGCKVVGVEIDSVKVAESRRNIDAAGLSDKITIIEGDVRNFDPSKHGVTVVYAYLYDDLLSEIKPALMCGRIAICPGHKVNGLDMELIGQCWVRKNSAMVRSHPERWSKLLWSSDNECYTWSIKIANV